MTLGQRISAYRRALGISQEELGARLGVSRQAVSKWETGAAAPDMENLLALAREFGVSVAELTATPEPPIPEEPPSGPKPAPRPRRRGGWLALVIVLVLLVFMVGTLIVLGLRSTAGQISQIPEPTDTEFYLTWQVPRLGHREWYEYLALGSQDGLFPFGTSLTLTEPEEVEDTDYHLTTLHHADCGDLQLDYLHTDCDLEADPEVAEQESITKIATMVPGYTTPRGVGVGDTKEDVLRAYGDDLVYCLKEEDGYSLVKHDYYYAFQTPETFGLSLCLYMRDGLVAGIKLEDMAEFGSEAYAPNNVSRFPLVDGEPDYSQRQEPEREDRDATQQVYIAWNQLVTNNNLSAEEIYEYRRDVFSLLPEMDWGELGQMGSAEYPDDAIFGLMTWLENQAPYSSAEILWIQMGCTAQGLDGAYAEHYADVLARALFSDTLVFARALATEGVDAQARRIAISSTAYGADLYPAKLKTALDTLDAYLEGGNVFTDAERGWAELLRLYLVTPVNERYQLPDSPEELGQ